MRVDALRQWQRPVGTWDVARTHCEFSKAVVVAGVDVASLSARLWPEPRRCGLGCENAQNQPPRKNNNHTIIEERLKQKRSDLAFPFILKHVLLLLRAPLARGDSPVAT